MQNYVGKQIDRYRIIERLGMGGMAVVYKAFDTRLERDVALKLIRIDEIPPSQHERLMKRFEREAKAMAKFSHPNIVPVHDYGEVDGSPYLVMEYIPGGTLKDRTGQPVPLEMALAWITPIANALAYAHELGVVHRDVKPSNILFDLKGRPILTDFGVAKVLETDEATLTGTGMGVGTPEYMAPEQWRGKTCPATDQYALGVVLYELLTGRKPYTADTPAALVILQATEPLPQPSTLVNGIPAEVEKVLYKSLAREPQDRYESMAAFQQALSSLDLSPDDVQQQKVSGFGQKPRPSEHFTPAAPPPEAEEKTFDILQSPKTESEEKAFAASRKLPDKAMEGQPKPKSSDWMKWAVGAVIGILLILVFTLSMSEVGFTKSSPGIGSVMVNEKDGADMVYVPAGEFLMGSEGEAADRDEGPEHTVNLDGYWIYQYEVTNIQYRQCIEAGECSADVSHYPEDSYPAVYINWIDATDYCEWAGGRLPTEAEWEKAARGEDGRTYPWGEAWPTCNLANYSDCEGGTVPVGSYPEGASPYGALDMAGNVWEWVADWYSDTYYGNSVQQNPTGPASGIYRAHRGGSWYDSERSLRTSNRARYGPYYTNNFYGFRCVSSNF